MKVLLIGGTGVISTAVSRAIIEKGWELWLLNRGTKSARIPNGAHEIRCDINDEDETAEKLKGLQFDAVADFIVFDTNHAGRDYRLFKGKTSQYIYISSASVYQKPLTAFPITENTPHANPYWEYSQNKIVCEEFFMTKHREEGFPITIVLPSHTYNEERVPVGIHGAKGSWQVINRIANNKPVIIHGDGTSLWTMTHADDFAQGFVGLIGNKAALGETVHITSDEVLTWNQIYQTIADARGRPLRTAHISSEFLSLIGPYDFRGSLLGDKAGCAVFDNSKLKSLVPGFSAKISFAQGIKKTIDYLYSHPELQTMDPDFDMWCDFIIETRDKALAEIKTIIKEKPKTPYRYWMSMHNYK